MLWENIVERGESLSALYVFHFGEKVCVLSFECWYVFCIFNGLFGKLQFTNYYVNNVHRVVKVQVASTSSVLKIINANEI